MFPTCVQLIARCTCTHCADHKVLRANYELLHDDQPCVGLYNFSSTCSLAILYHSTYTCDPCSTGHTRYSVTPSMPHTCATSEAPHFPTRTAIRKCWDPTRPSRPSQTSHLQATPPGPYQRCIHKQGATVPAFCPVPVVKVAGGALQMGMEVMLVYNKDVAKGHCNGQRGKIIG